MNNPVCHICLKSMEREQGLYHDACCKSLFGSGQPPKMPYTWEQLNGLAVGGLDEGHVAVTRRAVDGEPGIHELLAERVDVVDLVGEVAEVTALAVFLRVPVVRQLNLGFVISRGCKKNQCESSLLAVVAIQFVQPQFITVKVE